MRILSGVLWVSNTIAIGKLKQSLPHHLLGFLLIINSKVMRRVLITSTYPMKSAWNMLSVSLGNQRRIQLKNFQCGSSRLQNQEGSLEQRLIGGTCTPKRLNNNMHMHASRFRSSHSEDPRVDTCLSVQNVIRKLSSQFLLITCVNQIEEFDLTNFLSILRVPCALLKQCAVHSFEHQHLIIISRRTRFT